MFWVGLEGNCIRDRKCFYYKSIVEPNFTYCASVLLLLSLTDMNRLQKWKNKCMRNILNVNKYRSSNEMLNAPNCSSVRQMIVFRTLIFRKTKIDGNVPRDWAEKMQIYAQWSIQIIRLSSIFDIFSYYYWKTPHKSKTQRTVAMMHAVRCACSQKNRASQ